MTATRVPTVDVLDLPPVPSVRAVAYGRGVRVGGPDGPAAHLLPFSTGGSLRAERGLWSGSEVARLGRAYLDADLVTDLAFAESAGVRVAYLVRSYETPIAVVYEDGTEFVSVFRHSVTSTRHRGVVAAWLGCAVPGTQKHAQHVRDGHRAAA